MKKIQYKVYYKGKDTGIITTEKSIKLSELLKKIPNAKPWEPIEFKPLKIN